MTPGKGKRAVAVAATVAFAALAGAASAQIALIDDFEGGTNQNRFLSYWYYYTDVSDKGTSKVLSSKPGATSTELQITYKAKADQATTVVVEVTIGAVNRLSAPDKYATHQITHNIGTTWKTFEISMSPTALTNVLKRPS